MSQIPVSYSYQLTCQCWRRKFEQTLRDNTAATEQPIAALLTDLKQRDMLKDTLIVWSGEFGRTTYAQGDDGRDHNNEGFTSWMASGVRGGIRYCATDEHGYQAVENKSHIQDLLPKQEQ